MPNLLSCHRLTHVYGSGALAERAICEVNVAFAAGEACVLVGPSGSGKTTLLSILGCLLTPTSGELLLGGEPVERASPRQLAELRRHALGFVFQHAQLLPCLTLEENLSVVGRNAGLGRRALRERIDGLLERLEVSSLRSKRPHEASGGQRQRFAIARALVHRPAIVLADEPTAALDWRHGHAAVKLLVDECRAAGALLITVTHDTRLLPLFGRVLRIDAGQVYEEFRPCEEPRS